MDQLTSAAGQEGSALLIDCRSLAVVSVQWPDGLEVVAVHSGQPRTLAGSHYGERLEQSRAAEAIIGPLRDASLADVEGMADDLLRRRARHVVTENDRVLQMVEALRAGDLVVIGQLMAASHASLRRL
jgi:galactokinase